MDNFSFGLSFWIVSGAISLGVGGLLIANIHGQRKLRLAQDKATAADVSQEPLFQAAEPKKELQVYREQLRETERDLARGVLSAAEAERLRTEIGRRLLEADKSSPAQSARRAGSLWLPTFATLAAIVGAFALYLNMGAPGYPDMPLAKRFAEADARMADRPAQAQAMADLAANGDQPPAPQFDATFLDLMAKLRLAVNPASSTDLAGLDLLARNEAALGNFDSALAAQNRLITLKGEAATAADHLGLADILIRAARGYISPEAESALKEALRREPQNELALYYSGMMFAQAGRFDRTFALWRPLAENGDPSAPWMGFLRQELPEIAQLAGVKYTLPSARGPSAADIAASQELSPEDRQNMIEGMVSQLSERLANEGGTPAEWAQLIGALGVLGRLEEAKTVYAEAMVVFDVQPQAKAQIDEAARQAGIMQ